MPTAIIRRGLSLIANHHQVLNCVMRVNDDQLTAAHTICTAASCTTNCLAPVVKVDANGLRFGFQGLGFGIWGLGVCILTDVKECLVKG